MNFCETLPSMLKLLNDLLRGFVRAPETRLRQPLKGMTFTSQQFAGRSAGLARQTPSIRMGPNENTFGRIGVE